MSDRSRLRTNVRTALAFVGGAAIALAVWLVWPGGNPEEALTAAVDDSAARAGRVAAPDREATALPSAPGPAPQSVPAIREAFALTPDEVIDNPNCLMLPGRGRANDTGLVILPTSDGARFAVLDGSGEVYSDKLPFLPDHYHLGKTADGSVLAGLGDLRLNSKVFRDRDSPEPMRVYQDGQLVYENTKAWRFAIAPDGSSFYVHEPLAGDASRWVVHNLELRTLHHFDLGTRYTPSNDYESGFGVSYVPGKREIMFSPVYEYGQGVHRFYPVGDGEVREIHVAQNPREEMFGGGDDRVRIDNVEGAVFGSSEEGYVSIPPSTRGQYWKGPNPWRIERLKFDHDADTASVVWSREIVLDHFSSTMELSDDGGWLALKSWTFKVLDTATGETVFEYPMVDKRAELARLGTVLASGAGVGDVGHITNEYFRDNRLVFSGRWGWHRSAAATARRARCTTPASRTCAGAASTTRWSMSLRWMGSRSTASRTFAWRSARTTGAVPANTRCGACRCTMAA